MTWNKFTPNALKISDILLLWSGSFVAGFIGSVFLLLVVFLFAPILEIQQNFTPTLYNNSQSSLFPIIMSFLSFLASLIVVLTTYYFFTLTDPERYQKTWIHFWNLCFLTLIVYIFIAPIYIWAGMIGYENILLVFVIHILILFFGVSFLIELLNNYRYIFVGFYASFWWLLITWLCVLALFFYFESGFAKLLSLLFILPLTNFLFTIFKSFFEILYYSYYKFTWYDPLWDVFYQIEEEWKSTDEI